MTCPPLPLPLPPLSVSATTPVASSAMCNPEIMQQVSAMVVGNPACMKDAVAEVGGQCTVRGLDREHLVTLPLQVKARVKDGSAITSSMALQVRAYEPLTF